MNNYIFEEIPISFTEDRNDIINIFSHLLESNEQNIISFINPEIFLEQENKSDLHEYFLSTKYNFVDGVNLIYAINTIHKTDFGIKQRLPGTDFFDYLPTDRKIKVFF